MSKVTLVDLRDLALTTSKPLTVNVLESFVTKLALNFLSNPSCDFADYSDDIEDLAKEDHDFGTVHSDFQDQIQIGHEEEMWFDIEYEITGHINGHGDWIENNIHFSKIAFTLVDGSVWDLSKNILVENEILKMINGYVYCEFPLNKVEA